MKLRDARAVPPPDHHDEAALLELLDRFLRELRADSAPQAVALDASLERDLGLDSLARVELGLRVERAFAVQLPEDALTTIETPRALLDAIAHARGEIGRAHSPLAAPRGLEATLAWTSVPMQANTLQEVLRHHVDAHSDRTHLVVLGADGSEQTLTYGALADAAERIAAGLLRSGVRPGDTIALMLPTSEAYFISFVGILLAGAVPVPVYPPARPAQLEEHLRRHVGILENAQAVMLITTSEAKLLGRLLRAQVATLVAIETPDSLTRLGVRGEPLPALHARAQDTALLQYTSGSTGQPKGVVLSHANLLANIRAMGAAAAVGPDDVFVSWLPLYHDMGLIGAWLGALHYGYRLVVMSPLTFLGRPERWLRAIHTHRATISAAPNFAYDLCARKLADEALEGLDLSCWRWAFNGAEPVSADTMRRFAERFARYGFAPTALAPVYGLAEATLGLAFPPPKRGVRVDSIDRDVFARSGRAESLDAAGARALHFVSCGRALPGCDIRVVNGLGQELPERREGRIEFRGPAATHGYLRNPAETARLIHDGWLDTGDLGYLADGELYVTGRTKDLIIRGGHNIHPHELEEAIGALAGVRRGCVAVFGARDRLAATERLVVLAETRLADEQARTALRQAIGALVLDRLGLPADEIALVPPRAVLKTSSGKIRRAATRARYEQGHFTQRERPGWLQIVRVTATASVARVWRALDDARVLGYAAYVWLLFVLIAPVAWLAVVALPSLHLRWTAARTLARALAALAGIRITVEGDHAATAQAAVLVANHASYIDGLVLTSVLPVPVAFVVKRELAKVPLVALFLRRFGCEFVERFEPGQRALDTARIERRVADGARLLFFAEGTCTRAVGLREFHLGAFVAAAQAGAAVTPIALAGTRIVLRPEGWLPRRAAIRVTIGAPLPPSRRDWSGAIDLRQAARRMILRFCGEPDLAMGHTKE